MIQAVSAADLKTRYPNEWVLLGNPEWNASQTEVLAGIPIFHSKDKREVCYLGRDKTGDYTRITLFYTGTALPARAMTGIFNRVSEK